MGGSKNSVFRILSRIVTHHRKNAQQNTTKTPNEIPQKHPTKRHKNTKQNTELAKNLYLCNKSYNKRHGIP